MWKQEFKLDELSMTKAVIKDMDCSINKSHEKTVVTQLHGMEWRILHWHD